MRKSRSTGRTPTSGASSQWLPTQVRDKEEETGKRICWMSCFMIWNPLFFRVWAVLSFSGQHAVFSGRTDDHRRLLQHGERRMEANISNEGEEDGVRGCGDKRLHLCNRRIFLLKGDLPAEHWEIRPSAGLLGDCGDSAQPGQIPRMCLCFYCLVSYHECCHYVPNRSTGELCSVREGKMLPRSGPNNCLEIAKPNCEYNEEQAISL